MASEAFPTGMPQGAPWVGVPGHGAVLQWVYDSLRLEKSFPKQPPLVTGTGSG